MKFLGIDGCKSGWIVTEIDENRNYDIFHIEKVEELVLRIDDYFLILIDIPIGFADTCYRKCDILARKILDKRAYSIFLVPSKKALLESNYKEACEINYKIMGKKFSKQIWNIKNKIIELNNLLKKYSLHGKIRESHPEICFWAFNNKIPCKYSKKTKEGIAERIGIISNFVYVEKLIDFISNRKEYKNDDIIDSFILALTAWNYKSLKKIPEYDDYDNDGLIREIVYSERNLSLTKC